MSFSEMAMPRSVSLTSSSAVPLELELVNMTTTLKATDEVNEIHRVIVEGRAVGEQDIRCFALVFDLPKHGSAAE